MVSKKIINKTDKELLLVIASKSLLDMVFMSKVILKKQGKGKKELQKLLSNRENLPKLIAKL